MKCTQLSEEAVHQHCIMAHVKRGWKVAAHEWIVIPGQERYGRGDIVFRKGREYRVIECKRKPHKNVYEQAQFYGAVWKMLYARPGYKVRYGIWTCTTKRILGTVRNPIRLCKRPACLAVLNFALKNI